MESPSAGYGIGSDAIRNAALATYSVLCDHRRAGAQCE